MFSSRMFAALALVAAVAAYPADNPFIPHPITTITESDFDDGAAFWSFPSLEKFFEPLWRLIPTFTEIGPRIDITDDKFSVIVNVKGYKKDDLKVKVKSDFIFIQGSHEAKDSDRDMFASQFFHTYSLPANASASDVSAKLYSDGFLEVVALLKGTGDKSRPSEEVDIPVIEVAEPYKNEAESTEAPQKLETPAITEVPAIPDDADTTGKAEATTNLPTTFSDAEDDRRELTTASDREEVTEKDNSIPHGTEASEANELNEVQP
ncbi:alpha-crystallin A chain-like [Epargyreus clarus]|uniref:alpha-crystallin A chain-like n=1 Tax=Epargyreus clarus TaxID=520877 RepID=UPI003C2CFBA6